MRTVLFILVLLPIAFINAQKIGELAPEKAPEQFPPNSWGVDIMFGEGGFGFGTFYRKNLNLNTTAFIDLSISESKDEREFEYVDPFTGIPFTIGKKNRVFLVPINLGLQYRLFAEEITDNLRPYVSAGVGPTIVLTTPYEKEFFTAFSDTRAKYTVGGYVGFGANFGISKSNLIGLNLRYYIIHLFDEGVENLHGSFRKDIGSFFLTINIGIMY